MYDPPISYDNLPEHLRECPIHSWRARRGIELIHDEPTKAELIRIWINWNLMSKSMKELSDKKSLELFKVTNEEHYRQLIKKWG